MHRLCQSTCQSGLPSRETQVPHNAQHQQSADSLSSSTWNFKKKGKADIEKNRIELAGYLADKPEVRYMPSGASVAKVLVFLAYHLILG